MQTSCDRWVVVVPCFEEAGRLSPPDFISWLRTHPGARLLFVDDGSADGTGDVLAGLAAAVPGRVEVLRLEENRGKAEAVRRGMLRALDFQPVMVAFWDADLATPLGALRDFDTVMQAHPEFDIVIGTRARLLGRDIQRRAVRHYLGRVFATAASVALRLPVYDTQCGAKVFRASCVRPLFSEPFRSRWVFDVELLARCLVAGRPDAPAAPLTIYEMPLRRWHDVPGSKVRAVDAVRALFDLAKIYLMVRRRLQASRAPDPARRAGLRSN